MSMSRAEATQVLLAAALEERDETRRTAMMMGAKMLAKRVAERVRRHERRAFRARTMEAEAEEDKEGAE